ncbi:MAG: AbrB family transcriptional regulator, partial [Thermoprotei archaeon]
MERYRVKVHKKGLIVIHAEIRRRFGIVEGSYLELVVEGE